MQILSATKDTKEKLQKKRNLFGLGATSLIAACSGADGAGDGGSATTLPFKAEKAEKATEDVEKATEDKGIFTASLGGDTASLTVAITGGNNPTLTFTDGKADGSNRAYIYKLTATDTQHDLVVSSYTIDTTGFSEYQKGRIFIFWNLAGIEDETIGAGSETTTNPRLEIKGATKGDYIGTFAPDFLQIGGTDNKYDMVIRSESVDNGPESTGAIYILWDVADYAGKNKTIDLDPIKLDNPDPTDPMMPLGEGATAGSLAIYGAAAHDKIGTFAPEFFQIGGTAGENKMDMIIRSNEIQSSKGAIYILWDVADYKITTLNHTITLDDELSDEATAGSLAIYGAAANDKIGIYAPDFLQIGGTAGESKLDMIIRSHEVNKPVVVGEPPKKNRCDIYFMGCCRLLRHRSK